VPDVHLVKTGKALLPATDADAEIVSKLKNGSTYKASIVAPRNLRFHKKTFALLNLSFEYWQPESMVAEVERATIERFGKYLINHGVSTEAVYALKAGFLNELEFNRQHSEAGKDFESFRAWVTVKAGFFNLINSPAGPRKVPKSISFAQMDDVEFSDFYRQILNVCWELCLHKIFNNQDELAKQLLEFE
jgi:hypothetical protein